MSRASEPDVEIAAAVTAGELRFRQAPHVEVHAGQTRSARERLTRPVHPGRVYRRIRAAMRAVG